MDWQRVEDLFGQVVDLPPDEQSARLAEACPDDQIRAEVERLLANLREAGTFLETPVLQAPEVRQVGPYRLERLIGRGGMGDVYLGVRSDDEYRREVAVKLLPPAAADQERLLRFRTERQLLAQLEHPNIARLYDGGTTEDGRPYLVMEYIEGSRIDAYCDEKGLSVEERLRLFRQVCSAVSYAHRRLMIHRDIKPGNILVTAESVPKLLDFGVAKSLGPDAEFMTQTRAPMTPAYASPEQVKGGAITTASDIYALGIVLYELLTGTRPHQQALFTEEPTRPSLAAAERGERLQRRLRGDLDTILLKALRQEPERRYATVDAFSEDIGRHLGHLPVLARAGALSYRLGKFYRRNRPLVLVAGVLLVALVAFVVALLRQTQVAARERDRAQRSLAFMTSAFKVSDPEQTRGDEVTARQILDHGAAKVRAELASEPEMQATLFSAMGEVYVSLGLFDTAESLHREALELRRGGPQEAVSLYQLAELEWGRRDYQGAEALYRQALAMFDEGSVEHAQALRGLGVVVAHQSRWDEAEKQLQQALSVLGQHFESDSEEILRAKLWLGYTAKEQGDYDKAETLLREVLKAQRPGGARPSLGRTLAELGDVLRLQGKLGEAQSLLEEAIPMVRMAGETTYLAEVLGKLAAVLIQVGDHSTAEDLLHEALRIFPADHPGTGKALHNLGFALTQRGQLDEAEKAISEAIIREQDSFGVSNDVATSHCLLGRIHFELSRPQEALGDYESCARMMEKLDPDHTQSRIAFAWLGLGKTNQAIKGCVSATEWYERAYNLRMEKLGADHFLTDQAALYLRGCQGLTE